VSRAREATESELSDFGCLTRKAQPNNSPHFASASQLQPAQYSRPQCMLSICNVHVPEARTLRYDKATWRSHTANSSTLRLIRPFKLSLPLKLFIMHHPAAVREIENANPEYCSHSDTRILSQRYGNNERLKVYSISRLNKPFSVSAYVQTTSSLLIH
jgi:hypothetical protein